MRKRSIYEKCFKRLFDVIFSFISIILLSPLLIIVAILVRIKLGSPIIFKQKRPGKDEKLFTLYKFRTMTNKTDGSGKLLSDGLRLTKFGKFLRSTSIDELPELFNILFGSMSIIGPRPLLVKYLPLYNDFQKRRHEVRPGLTGYAQVNGRNAISWEERFNHDIKYIENLTLWLDIKIFLKTIIKVFKREGVSPSTSETMEEFKGGELQE